MYHLVLCRLFCEMVNMDQPVCGPQIFLVFWNLLLERSERVNIRKLQKHNSHIHIHIAPPSLKGLEALIMYNTMVEWDINNSKRKHSDSGINCNKYLVNLMIEYFKQSQFNIWMWQFHLFVSISKIKMQIKKNVI